MQPTEILNGYPRNLYYSGGEGDIPRLSDLRDALRKQNFDHKSFNLNLHSKTAIKYYNHNNVMNINSHIYNKEEEEKA